MMLFSLKLLISLGLLIARKFFMTNLDVMIITNLSEFSQVVVVYGMNINL